MRVPTCKGKENWNTEACKESLVFISCGVTMLNWTPGSQGLLQLAFIYCVELRRWTAAEHVSPGASCMTSMFDLWDQGWSTAANTANAGYLSLNAAWVSSGCTARVSPLVHFMTQLPFMVWKARASSCWECFCIFFFQDVLQQSQLTDDKE